MNKRIIFSNSQFIWHVRHEKVLFRLMPDTSKHLAWSCALKIGLNSPQRDFFYSPCHMPDMPDVFKTFWFYRRFGGGYTALLQIIRHACISPPERSKMDTLTAAYRYLNAGLAVIPIWRDARKNPHISSFTCYLKRLPTHAEWHRWAFRWPRCNIGLITGYWNNLAALDFDDEDSYRCWCESAGFGLRGQTWTVATRRGYHVWFKGLLDPGKSRNYVCRCGQGHSVLLRAKGGYCIVPPSIHHSGTPYRTVHKIPVMTIDTLEQLFKHSWTPKQQKKRSTAATVSLGVNQATVRIEDLVEPIGNPNGRGAFKAFCPFHDDGRPSAWVNPEQQRFGCNACWPGLWWDVVNVYAKLKRISNGEALQEISQ